MSCFSISIIYGERKKKKREIGCCTLSSEDEEEEETGRRDNWKEDGLIVTVRGEQEEGGKRGYVTLFLLYSSTV